MYTGIMKSVTAFKSTIENMTGGPHAIPQIGKMTLVGKTAYYIDVINHFVVIRETEPLLEVRSLQGEILATIDLPDQDHIRYLDVIKEYLQKDDE